jgi:hypothetical protein
MFFDISLSIRFIKEGFLLPKNDSLCQLISEPRQIILGKNLFRSQGKNPHFVLIFGSEDCKAGAMN